MPRGLFAKSTQCVWSIMFMQRVNGNSLWSALQTANSFVHIEFLLNTNSIFSTKLSQTEAMI